MLNQTFWTIITATVIFVFGQIIQNFILKPIQNFKMVLVDISHKVKFHSNFLTSFGVPIANLQIARGDMRDLSCNLESTYLIIPLKDVLSFLKILPSKKKVRDSAEKLILLSNQGGEKGEGASNGNAIKDIKKNLNLDL